MILLIPVREWTSNCSLDHLQVHAPTVRAIGGVADSSSEKDDTRVVQYLLHHPLHLFVV